MPTALTPVTECDVRTPTSTTTGLGRHEEQSEHRSAPPSSHSHGSHFKEPFQLLYTVCLQQTNKRRALTHATLFKRCSRANVRRFDVWCVRRQPGGTILWNTDAPAERSNSTQDGQTQQHQHFHRTIFKQLTSPRTKQNQMRVRTKLRVDDRLLAAHANEINATEPHARQI